MSESDYQSESDYHSATLQSTATLLSVGVVIVTFASWIKLASPIYLILLITVFSLIGTSMANHTSLYKINYLHRHHPDDQLQLREFINLNFKRNDSNLRLTHFGSFNLVNLLLGMLIVYLLYATMFGGVGT